MNAPAGRTRDLVNAIALYMVARTEVSAPPDQLLAILKQPPAADAAAQFRKVADALCERFIDVWFEQGLVVIRHPLEGCPMRHRRRMTHNGLVSWGERS
jgi:hypothetical protein